MTSTAAIIHAGSSKAIDDNIERFSVNSVMNHRPEEAIKTQNGPDPSRAAKGIGNMGIEDARGLRQLSCRAGPWLHKEVFIHELGRFYANHRAL